MHPIVRRPQFPPRRTAILGSMTSKTKIVAPLAALALIACAGLAAQQPAGFRVETVKSGLERPWSLNFAGDGRLLFTGRYGGELSALNVGSGAVTRLGTVDVRAEGEGGLLGLALDPDFAENNTVYMCYSYGPTSQAGRGGPKNRLSSFTLANGRLTSERKLLDEMPGWWNHNGCRVIVGPDNKLYASMGDAAEPALAQRLDSRGGKVFRINRDGSVPTDNPFPNSPVWTLGHRNVQGLAFEPGTGRLWATEHGPNADDELNVLKKGRNYGWPTCQGTEACGGIQNYEAAVKSYTPQATVAMSDMAFYTGSAFPAWRGNLFFVTLKTGRLYRLVLDGERVSREEILINEDYGRLRDVTVGADGFLYLATDNGANSRILRLRPN